MSINFERKSNDTIKLLHQEFAFGIVLGLGRRSLSFSYLFQKMYFIEDEHFARRLQNEFLTYENFKNYIESKEKENLRPVDSKLEYLDPTPSIHDLFVKFDKKFFWNTLGMVEVVWSYKMTKCAGVCSFEGGRGLCKISLSAPLLSLRPRKDLVETLLHEMIHAYLFVTHNYKDREDHGPEFHKHMFRINREAGTKITVYHTFFDEVEYYQRHVWRCDGPCQKKKPFFGFVKRAINRPPGPSDYWWKQHKIDCGGTFTKISEPEKKPKRKKVVLVKPEVKSKDIRNYFNQNKTSQSKLETKKTSNIKTIADLKKVIMPGTKTNVGTGTIVVTNINNRNNSKPKNFKNENAANDLLKNKIFQPSVEKSGNIMISRKEPTKANQTKDSKKNSLNTEDSDSDKVRETVRSVWANKFKDLKPPDKPSPKKIRIQCPVCEEGFPEGEIQNHVDKCLNHEAEDQKDHQNVKPESSVPEKLNEYKICPICSENVLESKMNDHLETCVNCSFVNEKEDELNEEVACESVPCPCCYKWFQESEMNDHIDECLTLNSLKEEILAS